MTPKPTNLRFLLALGGTKMVVLQNEDDLHIYAKTQERHPLQKAAIEPEHIAEAIANK